MKPPRDHAGEPDDERREAGGDERYVKTIPARPDERLQENKEPTDAEHRGLERANWNVQNRIATVAAGVGVLQLIGLVLVWQTLVATVNGVQVAQKQTEIAREGLISGSRPWLAFEDARLDVLRITDEALTVALTLKLKNVGHGIAKGTSAVVDMVTSDDPDHINATAEKLCDGSVATDIRRGILIFPDANGQVTATRTRRLSEVLSAEQVASIKRHASEEASFGRAMVGSSKGTGDDADTRSNLSIVGCVYYETQNRTLGRTTFVGPIRHLSRNKEIFDAGLIEFDGDVTLSPKEVQLDAAPGRFAD